MTVPGCRSTSRRSTAASLLRDLVEHRYETIGDEDRVRGPWRLQRFDRLAGDAGGDEGGGELVTYDDLREARGGPEGGPHRPVNVADSASEPGDEPRILAVGARCPHPPLERIVCLRTVTRDPVGVRGEKRPQTNELVEFHRETLDYHDACALARPEIDEACMAVAPSTSLPVDASLVEVSEVRACATSPCGAGSGAPNPPPVSSSAQGPSRTDPDARLREGIRRYEEHDYEGARAAFEDAYLALHSLDLLYNLARAELKSGHPVDALVHARQLFGSPLIAPAERSKAGRLLEEASHATGHIEVVAPAGARIDLDGNEFGRAPLADTIDVAPGEHSVTATVDGRTRAVKIEAVAGNAVLARFAIGEATPPTVGDPVTVPIAPTVATAVSPPFALAPATAAAPQAGSRARVLLPLVAGAVGVIAIGIGVEFGVISGEKQSDAAAFRTSHAQGFCVDQGSSDCTQYAAILNSQQQATDLSRGLVMGGGALAAGAIVTYLLWPRLRTEQAAWIAPAPGGVLAGGRF